MLVSKYAKMTGIVAVTLACVLALSACGSKDGLTGGTAATVNGAEIPEDKITEHIQSQRTLAKLDTEETWGEYLASASYTPESYREQVIDYYVEQELISQAAKENGIDVAEEANTVISEMQKNYSDEEAFETALKDAGYTKESYHDLVVSALQREDLQEAKIEAEEPTEEEILEYLKSYISGYDGSKKSSHILFNKEDSALAQEVLDKINSGELDFTEAVKTYSQDSVSVEQGGDVGWDALSSFVTEYSSALTDLEKDQVSGLVKSEYGIHIIKVTDVLHAPAEVTSTDQVPKEFVENVKENLSSSKDQQAYTTWYEEYKENADITINPMPENVPYNLDMTPYEEAAAAAEGSDEAAGTDAESEEIEVEAESLGISEEEFAELQEDAGEPDTTDEEVADEPTAEEDVVVDEGAADDVPSEDEPDIEQVESH